MVGWNRSLWFLWRGWPVCTGQMCVSEVCEPSKLNRLVSSERLVINRRIRNCYFASWAFPHHNHGNSSDQNICIYIFIQAASDCELSRHTSLWSILNQHLAGFENFCVIFIFFIYVRDIQEFYQLVFILDKIKVLLKRKQIFL